MGCKPSSQSASGYTRMDDKAYTISESRRRNMQAIRSQNTKPELLVRSIVFRLGYRYRLHKKDLPGKPDLVFASRHKIIFVHGCFWHQHSSPGCKHGRVPRSNSTYWKPKLTRNVARDSKHVATLTAAGWRVLVIWECETKDLEKLSERLRRFLDKGG